MINGVGPDMPIIINDKGGKQSKSEYRFDLVDTKAIFGMCHVLNNGAIKYGDNNWRKIPTQEHINHALIHLYAYLAGDRQDEHLTHAMCRVMFAIGAEPTDDILLATGTKAGDI